MMNSLKLRRKQYFQLSSQIAQLNNIQLRSLFDTGESDQPSTTWGTHHTIALGQSKIFVKRIPVTNLEHDNLFSTRNLYHLPTSYNYGFGGFGLGVFRELLTHVKTTYWVLKGEIDTFPLMYHYRIIPFSGHREPVEMQHWGNQANLQKYTLDRAEAKHELVLFLEYIPYVLETWLQENPNKLQHSLNGLCRAIAFLRTKGIIHFDAHFRNALTDGEQTYLTDFGLALDRSFALTQEEEIFFEQNTLYDYGEVLRNLGHLIRWVFNSCSDDAQHRMMEKYDIKEGLQLYQVGAILLNNIEQIHTDEDMKLDGFYVDSVVKYRSIIMLMQDFFSTIWGNPQKDTKLPHKKLQQLLNETGFLGSSDGEP